MISSLFIFNLIYTSSLLLNKVLLNVLKSFSAASTGGKLHMDKHILAISFVEQLTFNFFKNSFQQFFDNSFIIS